MAPRKQKIPSLTDMRIVNKWRIQADENGHEGYVLEGWEIQIQRGTDEWEQLDVENIVLPDGKTAETSNG